MFFKVLRAIVLDIIDFIFMICCVNKLVWGISQHAEYLSEKFKLFSRLYKGFSSIIIQTFIRNTDSYSDTDSEKLHIILSNQCFSLIVIKVPQKNFQQPIY